MTTYYLKSQLTEKLGTDANLAEQIQILPQTEYSANGGAYLSTSVSYDGTAADSINAIYASPSQKKYKYLSIKNTGSNNFWVRAGQRLGTFSSISVSYASASITGITSPPTLQEITAGAAVSAFEKASQFEKNGNISLYVSNEHKKIVKVQSGDAAVIIEGSLSGSPSPITGETLSIQGFIVEPGQTIVTKANGYMDDNLGDFPHCFTITYDSSLTSTAFDAQVFALEE